MIRASCTCGAVHLDCHAKPAFQAVCHCADCRAATGLPFVVTVFLPASETRIEGALNARCFLSARGNRTLREACAACAIPMFDRSDGFPALVGVFADRVEPPFSAEPRFEMWTASRTGPTPQFAHLPGFTGSPPAPMPAAPQRNAP